MTNSGVGGSGTAVGSLAGLQGVRVEHLLANETVLTTAFEPVPDPLAMLGL